MINNRRTPRLIIRLGCLALAILLVCPIPFRMYYSGILVQASPFVTICTILTGSAIGLGSILALGFSIVVIFRKRWFCYFICPTGLILDAASTIGMRRNSWWKGCPSAGKYIVLITASGAIVGYPIFMWMDPLVFFNSAFSVFASAGILSVVLSISGLTLLLLMSITSGSLWCARICPLGATQDYLAYVGVSIKKVKKIIGKANTSEKADAKDGYPLTRRTLLAIAAGMALGLWTKKISIARADTKPLRPPGAIGEDEFTGQCVRCGNCMSVCPSRIIRPDTGKAGILGFMAPAVSFKKGYCLENCNKCTNVCPSDALKRLTLDNKQKYIIGKAVLSPSLCLLVRGINDCDICMRSCPFEAVQIYWDEDSYIAYPVVDQLKCNGCGACELYCPTGDEKAINVRVFF